METRAIADDAQADAVLVELARLTPQRGKEQLHQRTDLIGRTLPVLAGKGEEGQHLHTGIGTDLDHGANRIDSGLVPSHARQQTSLRPTIIAIHDDRHVAGYVPPRDPPDLFHEQLYLR